MPEWFDTPETIFVMDDMLLSMAEKCIPFLDAIHAEEKDNPAFFLPFSLGRLVIYYERARKNKKPREAILSALSSVAENPATQSMISSAFGSVVNRQLIGGEEHG